jgi:hypothetical protein
MRAVGLTILALLSLWVISVSAAQAQCPSKLTIKTTSTAGKTVDVANATVDFKSNRYEGQTVDRPQPYKFNATVGSRLCSKQKLAFELKKVSDGNDGIFWFEIKGKDVDGIFYGSKNDRLMFGTLQ